MTLPWNSCRFDQAAAQTVSGAAAPTVLHLTSPNDFSNGAWNNINIGLQATNRTAPDSTSTATGLRSATNGAGSFAGSVQTLGITLVTGTHYSLTGYIKNVVTPVWCRLILDADAAGNNVQVWVNTATGATGSTANIGLGVVDSWVTTQSGIGNGYTLCTLVAHFTSVPTSSNNVVISFADSNGTSDATLLQEWNVWGWGA